MKKLLTFIMACVISLGATAQISEKAFEKWHQNKYSMFIHFGLYSELGGVWEGNPVTRGYSEQIQSFAGIFSDWYGDTALRFKCRDGFPIAQRDVLLIIQQCFIQITGN